VLYLFHKELGVGLEDFVKTKRKWGIDDVNE
jgi:hypothetical protein